MLFSSLCSACFFNSCGILFYLVNKVIIPIVLHNYNIRKGMI